MTVEIKELMSLASDRKVGKAGEPHTDNRRRDKRHALIKPVVAIPVLPDGRLDHSRRHDGFSWDMSDGGIGLELQTDQPLPSQSLLVGIEVSPGEYNYTGVQVRHESSGSCLGRAVGGSFGGAAADLLDQQSLIPRFDPLLQEFVLPFGEHVYSQLAEQGVLRRVLLDKVLVCPQCQSLPTFRNGCRNCGSARVGQERLMHHIPCTHVGPIRDFEQSGTLVCPRCQARDLIVGADFDYASGEYSCDDCRHRDQKLDPVGHCFRCHHRFPASDAEELELIGYSVDRLDPRSLIPGMD